MNREEIENAYFEWLYDLVDGKRFSSKVSYRKLLSYLHTREFTYIIPKDKNRAEDGITLRYRFAKTTDYFDYVMDSLTGPCSVFEMTAALAIRCERTIMDDPQFGNRTGQWFWEMITSLGLGSMTDNQYDRGYVDEVIDRFLNRKYEPDGRGGLFTVRNCDRDLRKVEIFFQLCYYLDTIT